MTTTRRDFLRTAALAAGALALPGRLRAAAFPPAADPAADEARLRSWVHTLRAEGLAPRARPLGRAVARVGELALGAPYAAGTLDAYLSTAGADPTHEPLTLGLSRFDCVTLVESCVAVARMAMGGGEPAWDGFAAQVTRLRYRGGTRDGYLSRLHYFSEWIADNTRRGNVRDMGPELGSVPDERPLRFMSEHRWSYPALRVDAVYQAIAQHERALDAAPRHLVPTERIGAVAARIHTGDVLAFATSIPGLDATHTGLAYRDGKGVLRALHAPLSGGQVQVSRLPLQEYVANLAHSTGILVARPLPV